MYFPSFSLENKLFGIHQTSFLPVEALEFSELKTSLVYTFFPPKQAQRCHQRTHTQLLDVVYSGRRHMASRIPTAIVSAIATTSDDLKEDGCNRHFPHPNSYPSKSIFCAYSMILLRKRDLLKLGGSRMLFVASQGNVQSNDFWEVSGCQLLKVEVLPHGRGVAKTMEWGCACRKGKSVHHHHGNPPISGSEASMVSAISGPIVWCTHTIFPCSPKEVVCTINFLLGDLGVGRQTEKEPRWWCTLGAKNNTHIKNRRDPRQKVLRAPILYVGAGVFSLICQEKNPHW